jgi:hypothetical protein
MRRKQFQEMYKLLHTSGSEEHLNALMHMDEAPAEPHVAHHTDDNSQMVRRSPFCAQLPVSQV